MSCIEEKFFTIDIQSCPSINKCLHPHEREGSAIHMSTSEICPITDKYFLELRNQCFASSPRQSYFLAFTQDETRGAFLDGEAALFHLRDSFTNPCTNETCQKVHFFIQKAQGLPFTHLVSYDASLLSNTEKGAEARKNFITLRYLQGPRRSEITALHVMLAGNHIFDPSLISLVGSIYLTGAPDVQKNVSIARRFLERALQAMPEDFFTLVNLGALYDIGDDNVPQNERRAQELLEKAVAIAPTSSMALALLGNFYLHDNGSIPKDFERAHTLLTKALKYDPENDFAKATLNALEEQEQLRRNEEFAIACLE